MTLWMSKVFKHELETWMKETSTLFYHLLDNQYISLCTFKMGYRCQYIVAQVFARFWLVPIYTSEPTVCLYSYHQWSQYHLIFCTVQVPKNIVYSIQQCDVLPRQWTLSDKITTVYEPETVLAAYVVCPVVSMSSYSLLHRARQTTPVFTWMT
jgi:hypothetical protein